MMEFIKEQGLPVDDYLEVCTSIEEIENIILLALECFCFEVYILLVCAVFIA